MSNISSWLARIAELAHVLVETNMARLGQKLQAFSQEHRMGDGTVNIEWLFANLVAA
jgi:hypothetical protein